MSAHEAFLSEVEAIGRPVISLFASANVKREERDTIAASLVCEIAELFVASVAVLRSGASDHVFALLRWMLDARADLLSLLTDDEHLKRMKYERGLNLLGYMEGDATRPTIRLDALRTQVEAAKQDVNDLEKQGFKPRPARERFEKAGIVDEFMAYQLLASTAHSDLESLKARHVRDGHLAMFAPMPTERLEAVCGMLLKLLYASVRKMPHVSDLDEDEVEKAIKAQDPRWFAARHTLNAPR
jgi:uncharacterized protein DUF5677